MRHFRVISLVLLLALGGLGGFVFARMSGSSDAAAVHGSEITGGGEPRGSAGSRPAAVLAKRLAAAFAEVEAATTGEALRTLWESCGDDAYGEGCRRLILARWAEIDPGGGFDYFLGREDDRALVALSLEWALHDAAAVAERVARVKTLGIYYALGEALATTAPAAYIEFIIAWNAIHGSDSEAYHLDIAFSRLYADDPEQALALAEALTGKNRAGALAGLAAAMAKRDAADAQRWAEGLEDIAGREAALGGIALEVGKHNPAAAVAILKQLRDPLVQGGPGNKLLSEMIRRDPSAAIAWVSEHFQASVNTGDWVSMVLVQSLWASDEGKAIAAIANTADEVLRSRLIQGLKSYTNYNDIGEMLATADGLPSAETRAQLRRSLLHPLAQADSAAALRYLKSLPPDEATPELWESFVDGAGRADNISGLSWDMIEKLSPERQTAFMRSRLFEAADTNPEAALQKLESLRDHPSYPELTGSVARSWARRNPEGAMAWIQSLEAEAIPNAAGAFANAVGPASAPQALAWLQSLPLSGPQLSQAAGGIARAWVARDGIAASAHIRDLPPGEARQGAIIGLVDAAYRIDADAALEWIDEIDKPAQRDYYRGQITAFQQTHGRRTGP